VSYALDEGTHQTMTIAERRNNFIIRWSRQCEDLADVFLLSIGPTEIMFDAVCEYRNGSGIRTIRAARLRPKIVVVISAAQAKRHQMITTYVLERLVGNTGDPTAGPSQL
jgi:hypothetical protein